MSDHKLQLVPLGGLGEFGMNSMAIRYGDDIIVVDAGMMFPDAELLGVDIVTPDFTYLEQNRAKVRGLILTHGHEDHIGAVAFFLEEVVVLLRQCLLHVAPCFCLDGELFLTLPDPNHERIETRPLLV